MNSCNHCHIFYTQTLHVMTLSYKSKQCIYSILSLIRSFLNFMCVLSCVLLFATPWTVVCQSPLYMEFSKQGYWSGLLFPIPADLPNPGMELASLALTGGFFTTVPAKKLCISNKHSQKLQGHNYYLLKFIFWTSKSQKITMLKVSELRLKSTDLK